MVYILRCVNSGMNRKDYARFLHLKAYALLKKVLEFYNVCDFNIVKNSFGKPYLEKLPLFFNISHCNGLIVCGVHNSEIGIDVENVRSFSPNILRRIFTSQEQKFLNNSYNKNHTFFRFWTLKESYIKHIGMGLSFPMNNIEFDISDINHIISSDNDKKFAQMEFDEYIISVCIQKNSHFDMSYNIINIDDL